MILFACLHCQKAVRILDYTREAYDLIGEGSEFWPDRYVCPECDGKMQVLLEAEVSPDALRSLRLSDLTPQEAFVAFMGVGLPDELSFGEAEVKELFSQPVRKVVGQPILGGSGRYVLDHLEMWDGRKVYFGAAPQGAVIYRIAGKPAYTEKVK